MKKKYIKLSIITMVALLFAACDSSYDAPTGEPNHSSVESSLKNTGNIIQVNGSFYLYDFSRGVQSRSWELTADATNLEGEELLSSTDQRLDVVFTVPGEKVIKLHQVFNDSVYVNDGFVDSKEVATEFTITVLDSVRANFQAEEIVEGTILNNANGALNEVQAGREVHYSDLSTGEPKNVKWTFTRNDGYSLTFEGEDGMAKAKISGAGVYDVTMIASSDFGRDTLMFTDYIDIIPSTDPMVLESVTGKDGKLFLTYGRDIFDPSTCPVSAFTLKVTNEGNDYPVKVSSIKLDQVDPSVLELTLDAEVYNTDEILVSYNDVVGNLMSADGMKITSFTDEMADLYRVDIFTTIGDGTVENSTNYNWAYAWWGNIWGLFNKDNNVSTTEVYEGAQSLYFDIDPYTELTEDGKEYKGAGGVINYRDDAGIVKNVLSVEEGKIYEGSMWVYIEEMGNSDTGEGFNPNVLWMRTDTWATLLGAQFYGGEVVGQWYKTTTRFTASKTEDIPFVIRLYNGSSTVSHKVYVDNIKLEELNPRP